MMLAISSVNELAVGGSHPQPQDTPCPPALFSHALFKHTCTNSARLGLKISCAMTAYHSLLTPPASMPSSPCKNAGMNRHGPERAHAHAHTHTHGSAQTHTHTHLEGDVELHVHLLRRSAAQLMEAVLKHMLAAHGNAQASVGAGGIVVLPDFGAEVCLHTQACKHEWVSMCVRMRGCTP
eukprot:1158823-Pelagomonas_calceolata.AAC.2